MRIPVTIFAVLFAFQANAQTENKITVAGRAWGSVESVSARTITNAANVNQRFRVANDSSFVRVRGDMKVTADLSAFGQIESQFALDGTGGPFDAGRNTGVGLASKAFGTLTIGRWDSPYKLALIRLDPWGNTTIQNYAAIMGQMSQGGNRYDARLGNTIQYWSPAISGLQVKAALMTNEDKSVGSTPAGINPHVFSLSVTWEGPLYVGVAYETRKDCGAAGGGAAPICTGAMLGTHGRDWGLRAGAGFNNKPTRTNIGVIYEHLEASADFAAAPQKRNLKRDAFYGSVVQGLMGGAHEVVVAGGVANKASGNFLTAPAGGTNSKTGAVYWNVAYRYNFNKDLMAHLGFVQVKNDDNAAYAGSGFTAAGTGPTYNALVLGTRYLF